MDLRTDVEAKTPADGEPESTRAVLDRGIAAYRAGRAGDSEALLRRAVALDAGSAQAWYYLGLLAVARQDWASAQRCLRRCVEINPRAWAALHYLGRAQERLGDTEDAVRSFRASLRLHPDQPQVRRQLRNLTGKDEPGTVAHLPSGGPEGDRDSRPQEQPDPGPGLTVLPLDGSRLAHTRYGVYEVLLASTDPLLRQPLAMMDALRQPERPGRLSASLWPIIEVGLAGALAGYVVVQAYQLARFLQHLAGGGGAAEAVPLAHRVVAAALVVGLLGAAGRLAVAAFTTYSIDRGRLTIVSGIVWRRRYNVELYRVVDLLMTRNLMQQLTGDASLVFVTSRGSYTVIGLGSSRHQTEVHAQLLDLVFALRANNYVRGIVS